jgi:hypothetical protein
MIYIAAWGSHLAYFGAEQRLGPSAPRKLRQTLWKPRIRSGFGSCLGVVLEHERIPPRQVGDSEAKELVESLAGA